VKDKLNIGVFRYNADGEVLRDMFQDELPSHPRVGNVDWQWSTLRFGNIVVPTAGPEFIEKNIDSYDLIFADMFEQPERLALFDKHNLWKKVVIFDTRDEPAFSRPELLDKCLLYIKRSWHDMYMPKNRDNILVLDFGILQSYLDVIPRNYYTRRDSAVTCTLNQSKRTGSPRDILVKTVKETDFPKDVNNDHSQVTLFYAPDSNATDYRNALNPPPPYVNWWYIYMHILNRTKILFTRTPTGGGTNDFRTYEAFSSGALVFMNRIPTPQPNPLIAGEHYIEIDENNLTKTMNIAKDLLRDNTERERIAKAGFEHAITYHSAKARVNYAMDEILKRLEKND